MTHNPWTTHTVRRRRAWHDITALGRHARSDDVGRGMTSPPLDSTHSRMTSGVACHHRLWEAHTIERRWAWQDINAFGSTYGQTTSGVTCHHCLWTAHTVGLGPQRRAWHDITALAQHARSDDVGHGMTTPPFESTHGRQHRAWHDITFLGKHTRSDNVERGMTSPPLESRHGRTMSGMA